MKQYPSYIAVGFLTNGYGDEYIFPGYGYGATSGEGAGCGWPLGFGSIEGNGYGCGYGYSCDSVYSGIGDGYDNYPLNSLTKGI